jgi:tRNA A37 threonylcarbamoyladenosine dehydratase
VDVLVDACDQVRAKAALAAWSLRERVPLVCVGAAGGKRQPQRVEVTDLAEATHDPLLASLRQRLRKEAAAPRQGSMGVRCVFSRESVVAPAAVCEADDPGAAAAAVDGSLNCHGYGSSVMVTATFGMVAAAQALEALWAAAAAPRAGQKADIL